MRGQRIGRNSSDLMELSGNLGGGITKTLIYGKKRKSPVGLKAEKATRALRDFAEQVKKKRIGKISNIKKGGRISGKG